MFTAWEVYKEITAILGLVALVVAVWKRRFLLRIAGILLVGHRILVTSIIGLFAKECVKVVHSRGITGKCKQLFFSLVFTLVLVIKLPKMIFELEIAMMRSVKRNYRRIEAYKNLAGRVKREIDLYESDESR